MYLVQEMQKLTLVNGGDVGTFQNCNRNELNNLVGTYFAESFLKKKTLFFFFRLMKIISIICLAKGGPVVSKLAIVLRV